MAGNGGFGSALGTFFGSITGVIAGLFLAAAVLVVLSIGCCGMCSVGLQESIEQGQEREAKLVSKLSVTQLKLVRDESRGFKLHSHLLSGSLANTSNGMVKNVWGYLYFQDESGAAIGRSRVRVVAENDLIEAGKSRSFTATVDDAPAEWASIRLELTDAETVSR